MAANTTLRVGWNRTAIMTIRQMEGKRRRVTRRPRRRMMADVPKKERSKLSVLVAWPNSPMKVVKDLVASEDMPVAVPESTSQQDMGSPVVSSLGRQGYSVEKWSRARTFIV